MKQLNLIFPVLMLSCAVAAAIENEEPKKPSAQYLKAFGKAGFASDNLFYISSVVNQIFYGNRNHPTDWKQLYVELDRLNLKKQTIPVLDEKCFYLLFVYLFDLFDYKHKDISSEVTSLQKNWDNLEKPIESLDSIRITLEGSIKSYLNRLLGTEGPDDLMAIRNCFDCDPEKITNEVNQRIGIVNAGMYTRAVYVGLLLNRTRPRDDDPMPNEEYRKKNQLFTDYKFKALESFVQLRSLYYRVQNRTEQVINNCKAETARKQLATGNGNTANVTSHLLLIAVPLLLATL